MPRQLLFAVMVLVLAAVIGCGTGAQPTGNAPPADPNKQALHPDPAKSEPKEKQAGGSYKIEGYAGGATGGSAASQSGSQTKNEPVEIPWVVGKAAFEKLREGMTLDEARTVLGLSTLSYTPWGEASEFHLVCKKGAASATLVFAGSPEVKLKSKSAVGLE